MRVERKTDTGNGIIRLIFVVAAISLQVYFLYAIVVWLDNDSTWIHLLTELAAAIIVIAIYGKHTTSSMKMPWVVLITTVPVLGVVLWFLMGSQLATRPMARRFGEIEKILNVFLLPDEGAQEELKETSRASYSVSSYLWNREHFPLYRNMGTVYYADTSDALDDQIAELKKAEHFIFMEYFAIEDKESFARVHEVLCRKVKEGVEVRLFYDDVGSIGFINGGFRKKMEKDGIKTRVFNPVLPSLRVFMNNRDHRKITVIDGKVAFTGGYNLANEYFNVTHPYGVWKDAGVKVTGPAVRTFTTVFLQMWNAIRATDQDDVEFGRYFPDITFQEENVESAASRNGKTVPEMTPVEFLQTAAQTGSIEVNRENPPEYEDHPGARGYVQPYADSPLDEEQVGENVYMSIVNTAMDYIWFITPYLILTDEMSRALTLAAERGVDVRIVTPGIPDKKITYQLTRSYYAQLARRGVRIYEYTPGFCHAKVCVSDDRIATCGTINLDYRSLYHHFEDGCVMYGSHAVMDEKKDVADVILQSHEVTQKYASGRRSPVVRSFQCVLRLISPLM